GRAGRRGGIPWHGHFRELEIDGPESRGGGTRELRPFDPTEVAIRGRVRTTFSPKMFVQSPEDVLRHLGPRHRVVRTKSAKAARLDDLGLPGVPEPRASRVDLADVAKKPRGGAVWRGITPRRGDGQDHDAEDGKPETEHGSL